MKNTITVTLRRYRCVCEKCRHEFLEENFSDFDYGRRIFRTISGKYSGVWIGPDDEVFDEFDRLMRGLVRLRMTPRDEARLFNRIFGISCDFIEGEPVDASRGYVCPKCGSGDVDTFDIIPKQTVQKSLPLITHAHWQRKSFEQKEKEIRSALAVAEGGKLL